MFGGQVLKPQEKGIHDQKYILPELKHRQRDTSDAVLDRRLLLAGLHGYLTFSL